LIEANGGMRLMKRMTFLLPLLLVLGAPGCRSAQLAQDQDQFRARLLDLYTNQIMDNLVRADQGLPIVQLDYSKVTGTITQNGMLSFTSTQTTTNTKMLVIPTVVQTLTHSFMNAAAFNPTGYQTNALTVTADPVVDHNEVYDAYLEFLCKQPPRLVHTPEPPDPCAAHLVRRCGNLYYWVPIEYKYEFLKLALVTTVQRGQPLSIPDKFENTVVCATLDMVSQTPLLYRFIVEFAKPVPNSSGTIDVTIKSKPLSLKLQSYDGPALPDPIPSERDPANCPPKNERRFYVIFDPAVLQATPQEFSAAIANQPVKIALDFFKPTVPNTAQLIKMIDNNLQIIRMQQQLGKSL
jgi:hypothetical protein